MSARTVLCWCFVVVLGSLLLAACNGAEDTPTIPTIAPTATPTPAVIPTSAPPSTPTIATAATQTPTTVIRGVRHGFSDDHGTLSPYVKPAAVAGAGKRLLAIYIVGSDLEGYDSAGTEDFDELVEGYNALTDKDRLEVVVAFGGADKNGWKGMKIADMSNILADSQDGAYGNESSAGAYLYRADGAHMGDQSSLKLFLDYLRDGYSSYESKFLVFWDHGNSYKEFGNDQNFNMDGLSMSELDGALRESQISGFDLIGFDACLMATMEVAKVIKTYANYMIASEETEPGHGWMWTEVIKQYAQRDNVVEAATGIIDNFVQNVHQYESTGKTLSLLDLSRYDDVVASIDAVTSTFARELLSDRDYSDSMIHGATRAQSYGKEERSNIRASIDLKHFAQTVNEKLSNPATSQDLDNLVQAVDRFVVYSRHDGSKLNSNGVAIDAPENTDAEWTGRKINRTWTDFQAAYKELKDSDTSAPVAQDTDTGADSDTFQFESEDLTEQLAGIQGTSATFVDDNLALVTTIYGFQEEVPPFEGDGPDETYFMAVAELEAFSTENPGEYFTPQWDKWWFTVEYDPGKLTEWIPMAFATSYVFDGQGYWEYSAEIDYYEAGKDYSGYEFPADFATLTIMVDEDWEVVDHSIQTYKVLFSGPDDEEGTVLIDKTTKWFKPGDRVQFWNFGFNLNDETKDDWFESSDVITFTQEPRFLLELLEFEDEAGELIEYQYAMWAEDISGTGS